MNKIAILATLLMLSGSAFAANWAVLAAGSNQFYNYRHQADICHAYQLLIKGGIPAENIIVFAFDDIATSSYNPFNGKLFNKPNGEDVYAGCKIDYKGKDVTPKNFLSVLKQDEAAMKDIGTGRVLKSTKDDKVFINFADHGAPGLIAFPSSYLYATDLLPVINGMWNNKQYSQAVFYLETCESGSMFTKLPTDQKFYALSAATPDQSSYAYYCPPDDVVNTRHLGTCLGDLFSIKWMEDSESQDTTKESLETQFQTVKKQTTQSQVMQWGDLSFKAQSVSDFIGKIQKTNLDFKLTPEAASVNSRDLKLMFLVNQHSRFLTEETQSALNEEIMSRRLYDDLFHDIQTVVGAPNKANDTNPDCYKDMIETLEAACGRTTDYGLKYFRRLYDLCASSLSTLEAKALMIKKCVSTNETVTH